MLNHVAAVDNSFNRPWAKGGSVNRALDNVEPCSVFICEVSKHHAIYRMREFKRDDMRGSGLEHPLRLGSRSCPSVHNEFVHEVADVSECVRDGVVQPVLLEINEVEFVPLVSE